MPYYQHSTRLDSRTAKEHTTCINLILQKVLLCPVDGDDNRVLNKGTHADCLCHSSPQFRHFAASLSSRLARIFDVPLRMTSPGGVGQATNGGADDDGCLESGNTWASRSLHFSVCFPQILDHVAVPHPPFSVLGCIWDTRKKKRKKTSPQVPHMLKCQKRGGGNGGSGLANTLRPAHFALWPFAGLASLFSVLVNICKL